ncbi:hypothetical protein [Hymenobacter sp. AT01-02]|uniref:hypothetical protein n=1 Tax=Hymenobacter sp. AT01-02 TaxID=1571877 RepID=UPI0005F27352|nr:hypothetical protein [Hymenobacter sp. AT01-02]
MSGIPSSESEQPQDPQKPQESEQMPKGENAPNIQDTFDKTLELQGQLIALLELRVQTYSARLEVSQRQLKHERSLLYLLARCDAGLLDEEQQREMWELLDSPDRLHGLEANRSHLYLSALAQANINAVAQDSPGHSNGMQEEATPPN